jgi:NADH-quinone oxidoreductase subunit I
VPRPDGSPRCVACYMCATACPAQCIFIEAAEVEGDPIEKYPKQFVIDELRCVVCGFCVEACPKDAIRMDTGDHPPPTYQREGQIYDLPRLLRGPAVSYEKDPWLVRPSRLTEAALKANRAAARPFGTQGDDEYSQTPGFSVRELAAEARARGEAGK